jgi:hypothetical protein
MTSQRQYPPTIITCTAYNTLLHPPRNYDSVYVPPDPILASKYIRIENTGLVQQHIPSGNPPITTNHYILKCELALIKSNLAHSSTPDPLLSLAERNYKIWQRNNKTASAHTTDLAVDSMNCGPCQGGVMNDPDMQTTVGVKHQSYITHLAGLKRS